MISSLRPWFQGVNVVLLSCDSDVDVKRWSLRSVVETPIALLDGRHLCRTIRSL